MQTEDYCPQIIYRQNKTQCLLMGNKRKHSLGTVCQFPFKHGFWKGPLLVFMLSFWGSNICFFVLTSLRSHFNPVCLHIFINIFPTCRIRAIDSDRICGLLSPLRSNRWGWHGGGICGFWDMATFRGISGTTCCFMWLKGRSLWLLLVWVRWLCGMVAVTLADVFAMFGTTCGYS